MVTANPAMSSPRVEGPVVESAGDHLRPIGAFVVAAAMMVDDVIGGRTGARKVS
jgi:hypothetical protein